jgi:hypothetical protein
MVKSNTILFIVAILFSINSNFLIAQTGTDSNKIWSIVKVSQSNVKENKVNNYWIPAEQIPRFFNIGDGVTVYPNFRPHAATNSTQSETSVDVHPANNNIVFCSANASDWPVSTIYGTGVYWTTNGGTNWSGTDNPGTLTGFGSNSGDPCSIIGLDGRLYENYISNPGGQGVSVSTNNGVNWSTYTIAPNPGSLADKNHYMVDRKSSSPYLNRSYCAWTDFGGTNDENVVFKYSTNFGQTWSTAINLSNSLSAFNHGVNVQTGPNGEVYATWAIYTGSGVVEDGVGFAKSTNGGATWSTPVYAYQQTNFGVRGYLSSKGGMRINSFPVMAVDRSGGSNNGNIYICWTQRGVSPAGSDPDIVFIKSTNGGTNWTTPVRVNNDALNNGKDQIFPWCTVDQATGQFMVAFYDSRNVANNMAEVYMACSLNGGSSFDNFVVSDQSFVLGPITGFSDSYGGDYIGIAAYNNAAYPFWRDSRTGNAQGWMAKVTFGPPCPVSAPSNPNPLDGATNVSRNLPQLSWTNGSGAALCEVWFGEIGSMVKVYDGSLITSRTISGPLTYNTTYSWQIIGKDGTCSTSGPLWVFTTEQDPNLVIETVNVYPQNFNYWTGTCNSSSKTQVSLVDADGSSFAGWMKFDISSIPNNATINSITFNGYLYSNNFPYWSITPMGSVNPETGSASLIYNQVSNNYEDGVAYSYNQESGTLTNGWLQRSLGTTATIDMQNELGQGWFAIGFYDWDTGTTYYVNFQGWAEANRSYLEVVYEYSLVADPTGITASAVNDTQIDVAFTPNASNNNVVIVWNNTGTFTTPTGTPPAIGQSFAGGSLLYNGIVSPVNHTGLTGLTTYYYKLFSYDGFDYSSGVSTSAATFSALDFGVNLTVSDNCDNNAHPLIFGTAPGATECFDAGFDLSAPPPPPVGAIDGRFLSCNDAFFTDIRGSNPGGERIWDVHFQPNAGCSPISLSWDPSKLPVDGYFHLLDPYFGTLVNVNMRTNNSYTDVTGLGYLQIKFNYQICSNFNVSNGWNMLSLPLGVTDNNYLTLFPPAVAGTLYGYEGAYVTKTTIENGAGYWLKFSSAEFVEVCGSDETETIIELAAGWNMIGGPNCNVPLSSVIDPGGIIIPGTLYGYSGSYFTATSIDGTKGYWIKTNAAGTITISCSAPPPNNINNNIIASETLTEFGIIKISDASEVIQTLYFDGDLNEDINIESFSMPPVPPAGSFDARLAGDYRLTESDEVTIQVQSTQFPIKLTISNINSGESYLLTEMAKGAEVSSQKIIDGKEILISNEEVTILKITKQQSLPITYNLEQNYPNPFNPSTTIKFSLPETANVTLSIYNALGQKVGEIVNTNLEAGWYSYQWDATNIATGIYIYELRTDKFVSVKKMILLK